MKGKIDFAPKVWGSLVTSFGKLITLKILNVFEIESIWIRFGIFNVINFVKISNWSRLVTILPFITSPMDLKVITFHFAL